MLGINLGRFLNIGERLAKLRLKSVGEEELSPVVKEARKTFGKSLHGVRGDIAIFDSKNGKATEFAKLGDDGVFHHLKTKYVYKPILKKKGMKLCSRYDEIETKSLEGENVLKMRTLERLYDGGRNLVKKIKRIAYYAKENEGNVDLVRVNGSSFLEYDYSKGTFHKLISSTGKNNGRTALETGVLSLDNGNLVTQTTKRTILQDNL